MAPLAPPGTTPLLLKNQKPFKIAKLKRLRNTQSSIPMLIDLEKIENSYQIDAIVGRFINLDAFHKTIFGVKCQINNFLGHVTFSKNTF